ncbi:MAG: Hsp20/alpha crystallin family protein [Paracoccaceae bacterium]|nr:Hsp20/alpha crystallin family protein [Paracoccaceae bacterium]
MVRRDLPSLFSAEIEANPFLHSLHKEIDRVFDRFRDPEATSASDLAGKRVLPALDIAETDDAIEITAELPGVAVEDLDVSITDGVLTLKGEKSVSREEKEKDYHLVERQYGAFRRSVPLGFTPDEGKVETRFSDGVLKLKIAKPDTPETKTQKIAIDKA